MNIPRILVVDDQPNLSALVSLYLTKTNRFEVCEENRSAHALATAQKFMPDLILMDVDMPGKDGGQVALEIKADRLLSGTPILFLTSLISRDEAGTSVVERGGKRFLAKPVNPIILIETIDRLLAERGVSV